MAAELAVTSGFILAYRFFDVAFAIDLGKAEQLWAGRAGPASSRARLTATPATAMAFGVAPLDLALDTITLESEGGRISASASARLYDFGAIGVALRVPANGLAWPAFVELLENLDGQVGAGRDGGLWLGLLDRVRRALADALIRPERSVLEEDYLVAVVNAFGEPVSATTLQERIDLVPLLSGESRPLSEAARQELLRQRFSYYADDLVAITWDRAFIYEPRGDSDVLDALEMANAQFLEMRYYDELLDAELPRMYDLVEATRRTTALFAARRFAKLARQLYTLVAEVTELTEKVENALQVTEDVYLARVYAAALELFRVRTVTAGVERKLAIIRDTYAALYEEASAGRSELLEIAILALILLEVLLPFFHR